MKKHLLSHKLLLLTLLLTFNFVYCSDDDSVNVETDPDPGPQITNPNVVIPNPIFKDENGVVIVEMEGIMIFESDKYLELNGSGHPQQNIWIAVDGNPKRVSAETESRQTKKTDIVFLVDNSPSMKKASNAVASSIEEWIVFLKSRNFDLRFGSVGYGQNIEYEYTNSIGELDERYTNISGAMDFGNSDEFVSYLNREEGLGRTKGFLEKDEDRFLEILRDVNRYTSTGENGTQALRFADDNFNFRSGAQRVYLNFTDEPNQTLIYNNPTAEQEDPLMNSVGFIKDPKKWPSWKGTIHTVFSADTTIFTFKNTEKQLKERPWLMSEYTGGTSTFTSKSFEGISLINLPVTGAMVHSYRLKIYGLPSLEGEHSVKITILSEDKVTRSEKTFEKVVFKH